MRGLSVFTMMLAAALGGAAFVTPVPATAAEIPDVRKVALVDLQRLLAETAAGKRARKSLEASSKAKQAKLSEKEKALQTDLEAAQKLSGQQLTAAQERLQKQYAELQQMLVTLQQDLAQQEAKLLEELFSNAQKIVARLARDQGWDLVLVRDPGTVILAKDALDVTGDLVRAYDKAHP